jgi:antitoxin component of RelBE/YafQ-DinJ toxin-antitoxin module
MSKKEVLTVRVSTELLAELKAVAGIENVPISEIIRTALTEFSEQYMIIKEREENGKEQTEVIEVKKGEEG